MSNHDREGSLPSHLDPDLARAWREASDEQPPSHLDAAIIAAARKSVPDLGEQPNAAPVRVQPRNRLLYWQPMAAAATVASLAFVLVQMLPRDAPDNRQVPRADKTVTRPERVAVPDRAPAQSVVPAPAPAPAAVPVPAPAPAPTAAIAEATANEAAATADAAVASGEASADRREAMEPELAGRAAAAPSSSALEQGFGKAATFDAAAWAAEIAALHASGDVAAAAKSLRAFRTADPVADTYLPDSLREWARTVE
jgi:hypothetical protein